ncbi:potassium channel family protein [Haloglycomyces albus]|uniref:potassium channel family protein n=1 Tax=Haloglycomyces albus TaxID=526067 RepID=UPI00046D32FD|nr:potassium channel protein [Haloglycomyces albus]
MSPLRREWPPPNTKHVIVVGDTGLALRFIRNLTDNFGVAVTAVISPGSGFQSFEIRAAQARNDLLRVQETDRIEADTVASYGLEKAHAVVLLAQDDVGNLHLALKLRQLIQQSARRKKQTTQARLIIRMYNRQLTSRVRHLVGKNEIFIESDADMVAPTYAAAAQHHIPPGRIQIWGRELLVTNNPSDNTQWIIAEGKRPYTQILPQTVNEAPRYLRLLPAARSQTLSRLRQRTTRGLKRLSREFRRTIDIKLRLATILLLVIMISGIVILRVHGAEDANPSGIWDAIYILALAAGGGIDPDLGAPTWSRYAHVAVTLSGALLIPVVTGAIVQSLVGRKYALATGRIVEPVRKHIIVVGLGNIGTRVVEMLRAQGQPVVAIEKDHDVPGVNTARSVGAQVLFGNASNPEILREAGIAQCLSVVAMAKLDSQNLEIALCAVHCRADVRTVLRIYDEEFAELVRENLNARFLARQRRSGRNYGRGAWPLDTLPLHLSWSAPRVAAASFAALVTDDQILSTIPVRGQLVHVAQVRVEPGSNIVGEKAGVVDEPGGFRLIGIRRQEWDESGEMVRVGNKVSGPNDIWCPDCEEVLREEDQLLVLASQAGLAFLEQRTSAVVRDDDEETVPKQRR